jgi:hypothetical protein
MARFERVLSLLRTSDDQPLTLRIGGDSADQSYWGVDPGSVPSGAFALTKSWLARVTELVRAAQLRLILDVNLPADDPQMAGRLVRQVMQKLPRHALAGIEVGNEPDIYNLWSILMGSPWPRSTPPGAYSASTYGQDFLSYVAVLKHVAPAVPLLAPALSEPGINFSWLPAVMATAGGSVDAVSAHRYPLTTCIGPEFTTYPTIPRLLSEGATRGMAGGLTPAIRLAHRAGRPFLLDEFNSVTCGGLKGVSDTFATALWAPDVLFELLQGGVDAVNLHMRPTPANTPFMLTDQGLRARPLLYGLILFTQALGPDAHLVTVHLHVRAQLHLKAWAVQVGERGQRALHVLLINKGRHAVLVRLKVPLRGPLQVERLLARSVTATGGVTLGGQHLAGDARWHGRKLAQPLVSQGGEYDVVVPSLSAALVTSTADSR